MSSLWSTVTGFFGNKPAEPANAGQNAEGQQASAPAAPPTMAQRGYVLKRILINSAFYWSWVPYIILLATQDRKFREGLIFGVSFSGFCVVFNIGMFAFKQKREPPYILDCILCVFFVVYLALWEEKPGYRYDMNKYMNVVVHAWLSFAMLATIAVRYPFTLQYAKEVAPEMAWAAPSMRSVCDQLAGAWAVGNAMTCLLCLAPLLTGRHRGRDGLNIFFNYVWPYLTLVGLIAITRWWPLFMRARVYIPRMLANTVKPEAGAQGGAGATGGGAGPASPGSPTGAAAPGSPSPPAPGAPAPGAPGLPPPPPVTPPAPAPR